MSDQIAEHCLPSITYDSSVTRWAAAEVLRALHPPLLRGEMLEARYISPLKNSPPIRRFYPTHAALLADAQRYYRTHHCYFGVALRRGREGTAGGMSRAGAFWSDIDAKLWLNQRDPKAAALAAIAAFTLRPSLVIDSGGGYQAYWLLADPLDLQDPDERTRLEVVNAGLARALCGPERTPDHVQDVARVLRLPGSLNLKPDYGTPRPVVVVWLDANRRYGFETLYESLVEGYPWALRPAWRSGRNAPPPRVSVAAPAPDLRKRAAAGRIRRATLGLLDSVGPAGYRSASEADAAIAAGLIAAGLTEGEVLTLLLTSARGSDAALRKGERSAPSYLARTVARAAAYVGPVIEHPTGLRARAVTNPLTGMRRAPVAGSTP